MDYKLYPLVLISAAVLGGCTVIDQTMTMTGAPPQPKEKVVTVYLNDFAPYVSSPFVHQWDVSIVSIDGKPVGPKDESVQLGVGSHKFTYHCVARMAYAQIDENTGKGTVTYNFDQHAIGQRYYPVAQDHVGGYYWKGRGDLAADGQCSLTRLTTVNPETAEELGQSY